MDRKPLFGSSQGYAAGSLGTFRTVSLERFSKRLTFRKPRISASCSGSGRSPEVVPRLAAGIIHFEKRCSTTSLITPEPVELLFMSAPWGRQKSLSV
jgi:hypothetical protein